MEKLLRMGDRELVEVDLCLQFCLVLAKELAGFIL